MIPPLPALQAFEAIARRKSFALAASELNLTPSAVSHQVARLEDLLGVRLFERSAKGVKLTPAGDAYLARVAGALGALHSATDDLRQGVRDSLYVHASPSFATLWLMPRIGQFAKDQPGISLFLSSSPTHSDFGVGQVDLDIRYGRPNWPDLVVEPLFTEHITPLASPSFIERHRLRTPADLLQVPLIQSTVSIVQWPDWYARCAQGQRPDRYALRFDRAMMSLQAAAQGMGVALESTTIGESFIQSGALVPVFGPGHALEVQAHFAVFPQRHAARREVRQFLHWLQADAFSAPAAATPSPGA
jgi:DNA-binding transcriptional LysR family regulator